MSKDVYRKLRGAVLAAGLLAFSGILLLSGCGQKSKTYYDYVVLAWNDLGEHCIMTTKYGGILPPFNTVWAQVIKRGNPPRIVTEGIKVTYTFPNFEHPEKQIPEFWEHSEQIWGKKLEPGIGLAGKGTSGEMDVRGNAFVAEGIPLVPFDDQGDFNPYPVAHIKVVDEQTGKGLGETRSVAPLSVESGCGMCHGGQAKDGSKFLTAETWLNILAVHDSLSGTNLREEALNGHPAACAACHADPAVGAPGKEGVLNLAAAMMGWHAQFIEDEGTPNTCGVCHPSAIGKSKTNPTGAVKVMRAVEFGKWTEVYPSNRTSCYRDVMAGYGISCQQCHGTMAQQGASLLAATPEHPSAQKLLAALEPKLNGRKPVPRTPWLQEPDCLGCHVGYSKSYQNISSYGRWVEGFDKLYRNSRVFGVYCEACHNSTHSLWGTIHVVSEEVYQADNYQPLKYQGIAAPIGARGNCDVCHTVVPKGDMHKNMRQAYYGAPHSRYEEINFSASK